MIATQAQVAAMSACGEQLLTIIGEGARALRPAPADKLAQSRDIGRTMVLALFLTLQGDREGRPNRVGVIEGIGEALGSAIAQQPEANQAIIMDVFVRGLERGRAAADQELTPRGEA